MLLAESVLSMLGDYQMARRIYEKALKAEGAKPRNFDIILSIKNRLGDEAWDQKLYMHL